MKLFGTWSVLLMIGAAQAGALRPAQIGVTDEKYTIAPLENRGGWVNPEDLASMPQCIAQQDHATWLNAMTSCTERRCTRHFGVICTHHQWLTQLSCLGIEFSPDLVSQYLPFCSRTVFAKSQLYHWIRAVTERTWLVEIGDANGLQTPSPNSMTRGYTAVGVTAKAPTCLVESDVALTKESFNHVMASCSFTSDTRHTGNAARPWEYMESQGSMIALDYETAGYDLTLRRLAYGDYFDKRCFCEVFSTYMKTEPCPGPGLASTRERLWLNATCGAESLPAGWTNGLQTTTFAYIPTENWRWPKCVADVPRKVIGLVDQCTTDACELDHDGYCDITRAVDRACFCRNINYDSCKGPCHVFEAREDYVKWLHGLCGEVAGWHGLPKHWRHLAAPTSTDMIPWQWNITPSKKSASSHHHSKSPSSCATIDSKLGSVFLINVATLVAGLYTRSLTHQYTFPKSWVVPGLTIAALHTSANLINAVLVQATIGYESIPITQLTFLWSSMPRLTWPIILSAISRPFKATTLNTIASCMFAEAILQALSAFPMMQTINYGLAHNFYSRGMARLEASPAAQYMYAGAMMWLVVVIVASVLLLQAARRLLARPEIQTSLPPTPTLARDLMTSFNHQWFGFEENLARYWFDATCDPEQKPLTRDDQQPVGYGTLPIKHRATHTTDTEIATVRLTLVGLASMLPLWIAQWLFWVGFINLSSEEYCPPSLGLLTAVWIASSVGVSFVATMPDFPVFGR
ncbi:hypothetical protein C7974DRAFT_184540 [Boeremia exigua]|uniref:uncharacterized protein n=1 Tax=Boeremia exigua TaxID=749465 RepID=UPI001E8DE1B5|nr:uncharacterized protein C7974DRAFT_184540 [Boeremia exigua]KAH6629311.1 hypothetical protein C7974DRAFT_184540 [Boeremia exigua]